ncbi:hypothetical protein [Bradyrhizobium sp. LHD-71]|uniref:hypothetical protein n=1 Tax=Bradyrhizobium sp. LHD-71 TaxID=3072141 RepID=UPI00281082A1|nr:hypothetical protein [Bradyrhizobium sp. LHD-71]MDQ8726402.1 hypothetical protein [Bradyrhizobium sp. LHD-71]
MPHFLTVRAIVSDPAKREAFDDWYHREHLPDAAKTFGAEKAWRFWSVSDPSQHLATYQFPDLAALERAMAGGEMTRLVADFDKAFPGIPRTREITALAEEWKRG